MINDRRKQRVGRRPTLACESLESRVVLTYGGPSSLLGSLSYVGVETSPVASTTVPNLPIVPILPMPIMPFAAHSATSAYSKLRTDLQTLQTELQSLAGKSGVTIADLQSLTADSQAIAQAGFSFEAKSLNPVISELAVAVAGGTSTTQALTDFTGLFGGSGWMGPLWMSTTPAQTGLFSGSSVSQTTITSTFNDLVQTITDSGVTTTDLSTVAADEAAVQADLPKLPISWIPIAGPWLDQVGAAPDVLSLAPEVVNPLAVSGPFLVAGTANVALPPIVAPPYIYSPFGGNSLAGALSSVGVVTSPVPVSPPLTAMPLVAATSTSTGALSQLQADVQTLWTELQSLAAKSELTIADLQNLTNDSQAISQAGFAVNVPNLDKAVSELATAVAAGSSTAQAQTDFTALFSGSSVTTTTINTAFSDLTKAIQDSKVVTADLTTVAADQAAIQADLKNLFPGKSGGSGTGSGSTGTGSGSGSTGTGTGTGSTGGTSGHKHKVVHRIPHPHGRLVVKAAKEVHARELARLKKR